MGKTRTLVHDSLKLLILMGFTGYMIYLALTGEILLYIAPHLVKYTELAAAGLFLFTLFQLYVLIRSRTQPMVACSCDHGHDHGHDHDHDHSHDHGHSHEPSKSVLKNVIMYGLFILPLMLGAFLPSQAFAGSLTKGGFQLGGTAASSNSIPEDLAGLVGTESPELKERFISDKYNRDYAKLGMILYQQDIIEMKDQWFIERLQALNSFADNFEGKTIKIKGFISREDELQGDQFIINRMAMTHCIADITPYGIVAESADASSFANDTWVELTGTIDKTTHHGQTEIKIMVTDSTPSTGPEIPYIYPDWDFASKL
ncbi:TIGR03943 family putative permease subunit [Paenibacillus sp. NPDC056722]|uniref:TIGR03943 family putative permease subunit n=1 Tax=Paenibacillus sp. NPDC056722 TaxID=3345924 RepID=UPI0036809627